MKDFCRFSDCDWVHHYAEKIEDLFGDAFPYMKGFGFSAKKYLHVSIYMKSRNVIYYLLQTNHLEKAL